MTILLIIGIVLCAFFMKCGLDLLPFMYLRIRSQKYKIVIVSAVYCIAVISATCYLVGKLEGVHDINSNYAWVSQAVVVLLYILWIFILDEGGSKRKT